MVHIGVLIVPPVQLLDIAPVDLFAMLSRTHFSDCHLPAPLLAIALPPSSLKITYIAHTHTGPHTTSDTTAHLRLGIDVGLADASVAPGKLDILVVPGPPPGTRPPEEVLQFIREHVDKGVEVIAICTGAFVLGYSGVLDGKRAVGPRGVLDWLKRECPKVRWEDKRYVNDGKLWTTGGNTNGMDGVAVYIKKRWPGALSETVLALADVEPRAQEYEQRKALWTAGFAYYIVKAWFQGLVGRQKSA